MILGRPAIRGISLGSVVCIIFVGLLVSIGSYTSTGVALALPDVVKTIFFNIFIFALGVKIGPQFFAGLKRDGWHMVAIGAIVAVLAPGNQLRLRVALRSAAGCRRWTAGRLEQLLGHLRHRLVGALVQRLSPTAGRAGGERRRHALGRVRVVLRRDAGAVRPLHEGPAEAGGLRRPEGRARLRSGDARRTHGAAPRYVEAADAIDAAIAVRAYRVPESRHGGQDHRRRREGCTRRGHRARAPRDRVDRARRSHGVGRGRRGRDQRAGGQAGARQGGAWVRNCQMRRPAR